MGEHLLLQHGPQKFLQDCKVDVRLALDSRIQQLVQADHVHALPKTTVPFLGEQMPSCLEGILLGRRGS